VVSDDAYLSSYKRLIIIAGILIAANCPAATHYVMPTNSLAADPYTSWETAGTNLIAVVNAAQTNTGTMVVWVTNGTYYLTNQVVISQALTLQSVNGREVTIVNGNNSPGRPVTNRCFYLNASGAVLDGFTITNGIALAYPGGGGLVSIAGTITRNCRVTGCIASNSSGGGIRTSGVITNCEIIGNIGVSGSGGISTGSGATIVNCTIASNRIGPYTTEISGVGITMGGGTKVINCNIRGNYRDASHTAGSYGGGVCMSTAGGIIRNSLVWENFADNGGGISMYGCSATIQNCTVISNRATFTGGGIHGFIPVNSTGLIENTVSYFNTPGAGSNIYNWVNNVYSGSWQVVNSCFAPTSAVPVIGFPACVYANNTQANPQFAGKDANNWRLTRDSPGVNAGTNQTWMDGAFDLDGRPRRDRFSGIVDMGCYEYLPQGAIFSGR